jgi:hypothetical protein
LETINMRMDTELFKQRIDELITQGEVVLQSRSVVPDHSGEFADTELYHEWRTSSLNTLDLAFGAKSVQYEAALKATSSDKPSTRLMYVEGLLGVLRSAKADVERGLLSSTSQLAANAVFRDLLDLADYVLNHSPQSHIAAATLAGAVLERSLRELMDIERVELDADVEKKDGRNIGTYNNALQEAGAYRDDDEMWGKIDDWRDLRNTADHHDFDKPADVPQADVADMLAGVRAFIAKFLRG